MAKWKTFTYEVDTVLRCLDSVLSDPDNKEHHIANAKNALWEAGFKRYRTRCPNCDGELYTDCPKCGGDGYIEQEPPTSEDE